MRLAQDNFISTGFQSKDEENNYNKLVAFNVLIKLFKINVISPDPTNENIFQHNEDLTDNMI